MYHYYLHSRATEVMPSLCSDAKKDLAFTFGKVDCQRAAREPVCGCKSHLWNKSDEALLKATRRCTHLLQDLSMQNRVLQQPTEGRKPELRSRAQ